MENVFPSLGKEDLLSSEKPLSMDDKKNHIPHLIWVVGIGPGHPDYMVPAARKAISSAAVLAGGRRALAQFAGEDQLQIPITGDIASAMTAIRRSAETSDVTVMVSGDPGYYSLLDALRREFPSDSIRVIPGISSLQLAFSRLALPWHGAKLLSFHGRRPKDKELSYKKGAVLGLLTDGEFDSHSIPLLLMEKSGWPPESYLAICSRLSYEDEKIIETTLKGALDIATFCHGILIVM